MRRVQIALGCTFDNDATGPETDRYADDKALRQKPGKHGRVLAVLALRARNRF
ncbi:MAG: hypothetical protein LC808_27685 [Actinobacteria bacterium]|nr:hypothetical protein [Actinomycetota bacterium]